MLRGFVFNDLSYDSLLPRGFGMVVTLGCIEVAEVYNTHTFGGMDQEGVNHDISVTRYGGGIIQRRRINGRAAVQ